VAAVTVTGQCFSPGGRVVVGIDDPYVGAMDNYYWTTASAACMTVFCYGTAPGTLFYQFNQDDYPWLEGVSCGDGLYVYAYDVATQTYSNDVSLTVQCSNPGVAPGP
jgi:hypothetical protein